jgi:hypothetical protein
VERLQERPGECWGIRYFENMFSRRMTSYIERVVERERPRAIGVCVIYFPDQSETGSWADMPLSCLGYNSDPRKLQAAIRYLYSFLQTNLHIAGVRVIPIPLFEALDGTNSRDYVARVEPSRWGGEKMAELIFRYLHDAGVLSPPSSSLHSPLPDHDDSSHDDTT